MTLFWIIVFLLGLGAGYYFWSLKSGKLTDKDGDLIADEAEEVIAEVKSRAKNVKAELADVEKAAKELVDQAEDVIEAAKGKKKRGRPVGSKNKKSSGSGAGRGKKPAAKKPAARKPRKKSSGSGAGRGKAKK